MMFCENCGKQLSDDAKFCSGCGTSTGASAPIAVPNAPQPPQAAYAPPVQPPAQQPVYQPPQAGGDYTLPGLNPISPDALKFPLEPGELLYASNYGCRFAPAVSAGYIHITNRRLLWTKSLAGSLLAVREFALFQKDLVVVQLAAVVGVEAKSMRGSKGGLIVHTSDGKKLLLAITSKAGFFNAEAQAARDIMVAVLQHAASLNGGMR